MMVDLRLKESCVVSTALDATQPLKSKSQPKMETVPAFKENFVVSAAPDVTQSLKNASHPTIKETSTTPACPDCGSLRVFKDGFRAASSNAVSNQPIQRFRCADYGHRFSEHAVLNTCLLYTSDAADE